MIIDSHQHFWNFNQKEFDWINDEMRPIKRSFLPKDLKNTISDTKVEGVISVQARQSLQETEWLLKLASENEFIKGVVGWIALSQNNISEQLSDLSKKPLLKGVRHVIQGEPDPQFILGENFNRGVSQLKKFGLVYDILILGRQLTNTIRFVDHHPNQLFVLDHIAKPEIKINEIQIWEEKIKELARRENVSCKLSGMVTEADFINWTEEQLKPYFDVVLEAFGPGRLLFGSDWPVCLVATSYKSWVYLVKKWISELSVNEQRQILGKNAISIYNLK